MKYYNPWFKLAAVSLAGIIISFVILWGMNQFSSNNNNMYSMNTYYNGMNMQGSVSMQGSMNTNMNMNTQNNSSSGMGMMEDDMMNMMGGMGM